MYTGCNGIKSERRLEEEVSLKGFCYEDETDRFVCRQGEYLAFQKLIYKKSTQNYYRLYSRSKNNVKTARIFQPVPQISVQSESMRVLIIPLFIEIAKK